MPRVSDLGNSKYLKQNDVDKPMLATIAGWKKVTLENNGVKTDRYILEFEEEIKPLVLNKTNGNRIAKFSGKDDFDEWKGLEIVIYVDPDVEMGGEIVGGVRVRAPKNAQPEPEPEEEDIPF